jgi:signal transduction histidine kinase/FixJ family two-component response regulator
MRVTLIAAIALALLLLETWLSLSAVNTDAERFDGALSALDCFSTTESDLRRDVLSARSGLLRNYDPLVHEVDALDASLAQLRGVAAVDAPITAAIEALAGSVSRQEELIETFKSDNALLQNSLTYFNRYSLRLAAADPTEPIVAAVGALAAGMLHLTLDTSEPTARQVQFLLDVVEKTPTRWADADTAGALLAHGRLLRGLLPATDGALKSLRAVGEDRGQEVVRTMVLMRQAASRTTARRFRLLLYVTSLVLIGCLVHLGLRLRSRSRALQRRAALEHVIAGVSMRFLSAPQDMDAAIDLALAEIGECVATDRVYFLVSSPSVRAHVWHKTESVRRPGWPDGAWALVALFTPTPAGIVHIPRVSRLPPGEGRRACDALGLKGWACATNVGSDGARVMLGLDALHWRRYTAGPAELSLFRMALDVILNAIERQSMELERARLETRLQQCRRMETVGALASGIAHNFNNIVGAILGFAEMAEAQVPAGSRPALSLGEIRQAGERARELVDQILAFGRRREAHRRPTSARALVAESASLLRASLPPGIELLVPEPAVAAIVSVEPAQLQQVIMNLCINASQAMDGTGQIEIEVRVHDVGRARSFSHGEIEPGRCVCIAVSDTGRGMDDTTLQRIFDPFFTTRSGGNGLGLATVREIVRDHGGAIDVRSAPNAGSRFEVWLGCIAFGEPVPTSDASTLPFGHGQTVLIVDDDREQLLRSEDILAALGYEPVGFRRFEDAFASCWETPERFDAFVIGSFSPVTSALALTTSLRKAIRGRPILISTACADGVDAKALMAAGVLEIVSRPLHASEIASALARCFASPERNAAGSSRQAVLRFDAGDQREPLAHPGGNRILVSPVKLDAAGN